MATHVMILYLYTRLPSSDDSTFVPHVITKNTIKPNDFFCVGINESKDQCLVTYVTTVVCHC